MNKCDIYVHKVENNNRFLGILLGMCDLDVLILVINVI